MKYQPEIDGLRAIAVLGVILFHAGVPAFGGGFAGVDVFFVISGYLITTIILTGIERRSFTLADFYLRRARRILPALYVVILASLPFAWHLLLANEMVSFGRSIIATLLFCSNLFFWRESGYWETASEMKPLLHTWSLGIEEQYYLFFPLLCVGLLARTSRPFLLWLLVAFSLLSLMAGQLSVHRYPGAAFYLLPTRAWELGIGSLIAILRLDHRNLLRIDAPWLRTVVSAAGLAAILWSYYAFSEHTPFPSCWALFPTLGAGLVILYAGGGTWVGRLLSTRLMVGTGLISYSLYLWHQPVFVFARHLVPTGPGAMTYAGLVVVSFVLAYGTWRFVETPFRKGRLAAVRIILPLVSVASVAMLLFGMAAVYRGGFEGREVLRRLRIANYQPDNVVLLEESWDILREASGDPEYFVTRNESDRVSWFDRADGRPRLLVVGNSHSKDIFNILHLSDYGRSLQLARFGVQLHDITAGDHELYRCPNYRSADVIVLCSRYNAGRFETLADVVDRQLENGKLVVLVKPICEFPDRYDYTLADLELHRLARLGGEALDPPRVAEGINRRFFADFSGRPRRPENIRVSALMERLADASEAVLVVDRMDYLVAVPGESLHGVSPSLEKFFYDYGHHTVAGARFFGRRIGEIGWLDEVMAALEAREREAAGAE